jgi:hypothetical protein
VEYVSNTLGVRGTCSDPDLGLRTAIFLILKSRQRVASPEIRSIPHFGQKVRKHADLVRRSQRLRGSCPARVAYDYQNEPNDEKYGKVRVVKQTVDGQQRGSHDKEETSDSGELNQRSHKESDIIS